MIVSLLLFFALAPPVASFCVAFMLVVVLAATFKVLCKVYRGAEPAVRLERRRDQLACENEEQAGASERKPQNARAGARAREARGTLERNPREGCDLGPGARVRTDAPVSASTT